MRLTNGPIPHLICASAAEASFVLIDPDLPPRTLISLITCGPLPVHWCDATLASLALVPNLSTHGSYSIVVNSQQAHRWHSCWQFTD